MPRENPYRRPPSPRRPVRRGIGWAAALIAVPTALAPAAAAYVIEDDAATGPGAPGPGSGSPSGPSLPGDPPASEPPPTPTPDPIPESPSVSVATASAYVPVVTPSATTPEDTAHQPEPDADAVPRAGELTIPRSDPAPPPAPAGPAGDPVNRAETPPVTAPSVSDTDPVPRAGETSIPSSAPPQPPAAVPVAGPAGDPVNRPDAVDGASEPPPAPEPIDDPVDAPVGGDAAVTAATDPDPGTELDPDPAVPATIAPDPVPHAGEMTVPRAAPEPAPDAETTIEPPAPETESPRSASEPTPDLPAAPAAGPAGDPVNRAATPEPPPPEADVIPRAGEMDIPRSVPAPPPAPEPATEPPTAGPAGDPVNRSTTDTPTAPETDPVPRAGELAIPSTGTATPPADVIAIEDGDSLWEIARAALGPDADVPAIQGRVDAIADANANVLADPDVLQPGLKLVDPEAPVYVAAPEPPPRSEINDARLAATDEPDRLHLINPDTGAEYTDAEIAAAVSRADARAAAAQEAAERRVLGADEPDALHIINPETGAEFTDAELADLAEGRAAAVRRAEDRLLAADEPDRLHLINPETGREFTDAEIVDAVEAAGDRRVTERADDFTLEEKVSIAESLGFEVPEDLTPADVAGINEILGAVPDGVLGRVVNEGWTVEFDAPIPGVGTPGRGIVQAGASAGITRSVEVSLSDVQMDADFAESQVFEIAVGAGVDLNAGVGGKTLRQRIYSELAKRGKLPDWAIQSGWRKYVAGGLPGAADYTHEFGTEIRYEATVNPEQGDRLAAGDGSVAPDIFAPLDMSEGNAVLIRGSAVESTTMAGRYKLAYAEETLTDLSGLGFGVERLDGDRVVIVSGPIDEVERELFLGAKKFGIAIGLEAGHSWGSSDLDFAELDLATPEGRAAYQDFILSGVVPADSDGVSGTRESVFGESSLGGTLRVGGLGGTLSLSETDWRRDVTTLPDGSQEGLFVEHDRGKTVEMSQVMIDGDIDYDESVYRVVVADVEGNTVSRLIHGFGGDPAGAGGRDADIQLTFTGAELVALTDAARAWMVETMPDPDHRAAVMENPSPITDIVPQLAAAETTEEAWQVLRTAEGSWLVHGALAELSVGLDEDASLPGDLEFRTGD